MTRAHESGHESRPQWKRYLFLFLISMFDFGSTYVYDFPSSLELILRNNYGFSPAHSLYLYSAYSMPNLFVNILGGLLIIKYGYKRCLRLYTCCVTGGQALFAIGCLTSNYSIMLLGRFILGCGAENLMITQYYSSHQTFESEFHTTAIGMNQSFTYLASFLGFYLLPLSYIRTDSVPIAAALSVFAPLMSLVCVFTFVRLKDEEEDLEKKLGKDLSSQNNQHKTTEFTTRDISLHSNSSKSIEDEEVYHLRTHKKESEENNYQHSEFETSTVLDVEADEKSVSNKDDEIFDIRNFSIVDLKHFPKIFWTLCLLPFTLSCAYFQFTNICTTLIKVKFGLTYSQSKNLPTIFPLTLMILLPILSATAEKYGRRGYYLVGSSILGIVTYVSLLLANEHQQWTKVPLMLLMGSFFSLYSCVYWTAVTQVLPHRLVNIGLSIANTAQNLSNFLFPLLFGYIIQGYSYHSLQNFLLIILSLLFLGLLLSVKITQLDYSGSRSLYAGQYSN